MEEHMQTSNRTADDRLDDRHDGGQRQLSGLTAGLSGLGFLITPFLVLGVILMLFDSVGI